MADHRRHRRIIASLSVVWLNAGIPLAFEDSRDSQYQLPTLAQYSSGQHS